MTNEEWANSTSAPDMLEALFLQDPEYFETLIPILHRYFLACCWKIQNLIPQKGLRDGLKGAEQWARGEINDDEFRKFDWRAEADCFAIEDAKEPEDLKYLKTLIDSIDEVKNMPFAKARQRLQDAAYFTNSAMCYPELSSAPFDHELCTSQFLCPDILRNFVNPRFEGNPKKEALDPVKIIPFRTAFGKIKGPLPDLDKL